MLSNTGFFWVRHLLYFNTCHKVHFGNWSGLKEKESSSSHKHLDNCLLQHEKQLEVSGSWERRGGSGCCGSAVCVKCKKREGTERGEERSCALRVRGRWTSVAELCTGGRKKRKQSARGKAIVGLLGDHKSNKKSQYNDFSRKVQFREINQKQLLVIKSLESVRYLPCTSPCYTVGKAFRHVDGQVH